VLCGGRGTRSAGGDALFVGETERIGGEFFGVASGRRTVGIGTLNERNQKNTLIGESLKHCDNDVLACRSGRENTRIPTHMHAPNPSTS
jgi:hypothetical protein